MKEILILPFAAGFNYCSNKFAFLSIYATRHHRMRVSTLQLITDMERRQSVHNSTTYNKYVMIVLRHQVQRYSSQFYANFKFKMPPRQS